MGLIDKNSTISVVGAYKIIGKLSIILLIFFSLQGKVVVRLMNGFGSGHPTAFAKEAQKHDCLTKLQGFTKKLKVLALPVPIVTGQLEVPGPVVFVSYINHHRYRAYNTRYPITLISRGPPSFAL